jgi:hypothetical protein
LQDEKCEKRKKKQTELKKDMKIQYSLEKLKHICLSLFIGFVSFNFLCSSSSEAISMLDGLRIFIFLEMQRVNHKRKKKGERNFTSIFAFKNSINRHIHIK